MGYRALPRARIRTSRHPNDPMAERRDRPKESRLSSPSAMDVQMRAHEAAWAQAFDLERARLLALLPGVLLAVEHIGSTAVDGLLAKPAIDLMAQVASLEGVDALVNRLCDNGDTTSKAFNATLTDGHG